MRLIDADELVYTKELYPYGNGEYKPVNVIYETDIDAAPTIDAVPVIRCKDCKYLKWHILQYKKQPFVAEMYECKYLDCCCDPTDFCSYAERREDETD